ncbi:tetratricopeptide repeat protein [Psychromonas sp. Urea-02u-13]|uniref:tetratricopeptide repeat protein n=1 Tax=Psychromonas sp. Urea-02u-13 TaxID=2058326 RepID=UPI000C323F47|nr:SEL1-like repeat protein [Psychromonas sp. Urea-02u-13]PKG38213.1 flagellar protein MotX [Psychromonas sp. Urea-02u-13]
MLHKSMLLLLFIFAYQSYLHANSYYGGKYEVIQLYTQDELTALIDKNQHLQRVKKDECQLVEDIEAHALKIQEPSYVYLWGDMLAWGVCVERNAPLGIHYIKQSAKQGLLPAIEQLGRYYERGILVRQNKDRAIIFYREAALQGFVNAQINYVRMLNEGYGSPVDYEDAYTALFNSVIADTKKQKNAQKILDELASKMPEHIVKRASTEAI